MWVNGILSYILTPRPHSHISDTAILPLRHVKVGKREPKCHYEAEKLSLVPEEGDRNQISPDSPKRPWSPVPTTRAALRAPALWFHRAVPTRAPWRGSRAITASPQQPSFPEHRQNSPTRLIKHTDLQHCKKSPSILVLPLIISPFPAGESPDPRLCPTARTSVPPPSRLAPPHWKAWVH